MSREEAARAYLDVMLGFRSDYEKFQRAGDRLSDAEKQTLQDAACGPHRAGSAAHESEADFFGITSENEYQYRKHR
ncbi:MAG TPA: hypothetical protein DCO77_14245 [Nitrospiraceae bacterium]|nr:hypothetical protein [Nitrospiraceae bacterium]